MGELAEAKTDFPVTASVLSTAALLRTVEVEYDVGAPLGGRLHHAGVTETHAITTTRGQFMVRAYRANWRTDEEVTYELEAIQYLAGRGVSVAAPVVRRDGTLFRVIHAPEGPRQLVLFEYAAGRAGRGLAGFSAAFGRSLAELHAASGGFQPAHQRIRLDLGALLDVPLQRIGPLLSHRPADWQYLQALSERLSAGIETLAAEGLDWGFCHGDAFGGNAHLEPETATVTHFDFDDCGPGWRAYDLATYRWICAWRGADAVDARWDEFLHGYQQRRAVADLDLRAVPLFVVVREIWVVGQNVRMAPIRGHWWLINFDDRFRFLRTWEREHLSDG